MPEFVPYLFVYGTLRQGFDNPYARRLSREGGFMAAAAFQGCLYDIGHYPGVVASERASDQVLGDLFRLPETTGLLRWLDAYEGCSLTCAKPHEYVREVRTMRMHDDTPVRAWVYLYNRNVRRLRRIPSGDYRQWLRRAGGRSR